MSYDPRETLDALIRAHGQSYSGLSAMLGKNPAYIQQYIKRGSPKKLDEEDRRLLAEFFGVAESELGAPEPRRESTSSLHRISGARPAPRVNRRLADMQLVPRLDLGASAGGGALDQQEHPSAHIAFDRHWLRQLGAGRHGVNMIRVEGDSMEPTLGDGDDILVAISGERSEMRARDGIYVLRMEDALLVKRIAFRPDGRLSVTSDNPVYPGYPDLPASQVHIVGRVIWAGRRV